MTRCLRTGRISANTYGWRIALADRILDFNQLDIARDRVLGTNGYPDYLNGIILESTVIPGGPLFFSDVVTSLPYREGTFRQPLGPTVGPICFDDQEILTLRVSICKFLIGPQFFTVSSHRQDIRGYISMHIADLTYTPRSLPALEATPNRAGSLGEEE